MKTSKIPHAGTILLSEPFMPDSNFKRSVILLCEAKADGSFGFVINKKLDTYVHDAIEGFPKFNAPLYLGGPVQIDTLHYVHNLGSLIEGSVRIEENLYWGGNFEMVKVMIEEKIISPDNIRFFIGYSGWGPGQLENELEQKSWIAADGMASKILGFKQTENELWKEILTELGGNYKILSNFPESPVLN